MAAPVQLMRWDEASAELFSLIAAAGVEDEVAMIRCIIAVKVAGIYGLPIARRAAEDLNAKYIQCARAGRLIIRVVWRYVVRTICSFPSRSSFGVLHTTVFGHEDDGMHVQGILICLSM